MHNDRITRFTTMHTCTVNHVDLVLVSISICFTKNISFILWSFFDRFKMDLSIAEAEVFEMNSFFFFKKDHWLINFVNNRLSDCASALKCIIYWNLKLIQPITVCFLNLITFYLLITLYFILIIQRSKRNRHFRFEIDLILVSMPIQAEIKCQFNMKRLNNTFLIEVETIQKKNWLIIELIETISNCTRNLKSNQMGKNYDWINFLKKCTKLVQPVSQWRKFQRRARIW